MQRKFLKNILITGFVFSLIESHAMSSDVQAVLTDRAKAVLQEVARNGGRNLKPPFRFLLFLRRESTTSDKAGFAPVDRKEIAQSRADAINAALSKGLNAKKFKDVEVKLPPALPTKRAAPDYWVWVSTKDTSLIRPITDLLLKTQTCVETLDIEEANVTIAGRFSADRPEPFGPSLRVVKSNASDADRLKLIRAILQFQSEGQLKIVSNTESSLVLRCEPEKLAEIQQAIERFPKTTFSRLEIAKTTRNPLSLREYSVSHKSADTVTALVAKLKQKNFTLIVTKSGRSSIRCRMSRVTRDALRDAGFRVR